ncbi:MAG: small multi-drug export protein [Lentisphaeria bacterium]|nr:small multi-drug export protein [Lentisphaeria bacterium]
MVVNRKRRRRPVRLRWRAIVRTQEGAIFLLGLFFAVLILASFFVAGTVAPARAGALAAIVSAHLTGGRAAGVAVATNLNFDRLETILLGSLIEGTIVCLFFSAFCLSCKKLVRLPWLDDAMRNVQESAQSQRGRMLRWGIPGLILFVWFPFLMTGPVVGSVIGFLLGMRPWVTVATVMLGTVSAIVSWTFLMDRVSSWIGTVGNVVPLVVVLLLITVVVAYRIRRYRDSRGARRAAALPLDRPPLPSSADLAPPETRRPR